MITVNQEKLKPILRERFKRERQALVDAITVEVEGMVFQGDEVSQGRMARAAVALNEGETVVWVLANNQAVQVNKAQLTEALRLAGAAQAAIWVQ